MRIAFDAKRYFNNKTGLGNYSRSIVHALVSQFPEHDFFLIHNKEEKPLLDLPNLKTLSFRGKGGFWRTFLMAKDLQKFKMDVFHGLSNEIPTGLDKRKIKSVVTIHDVIFMRYPEYYRFFDRVIYRKKTGNAVKNANRIVATSKATAADLQKYYLADSSKMEVIYQPVNEAFYLAKTGIPIVDGNYFIYVSSFTYRKNHGTLIQAFARIQKMLDWNLVLVGIEGETYEATKRFIQNEHLENRVKIFKNASQSDLVNLMQNASAFVYPSLFEGFGIPLAEAAVCGLPIVASNIGVFTELAEDAALFFHPNKYEEIADAMLRITDPTLQAKLRLKLSKILHKVEHTGIAKQIMQLYAEI